MLRAWGLTIEEGGEKWRAVLPDGTKLVVMAPTFHDGNPSAAFIEAYRALEVTAEQFWAGPQEQPVDMPPVSEQPQKRKPREQYINKVADFLVQFSAPATIDRIATECGITSGQASSAASQLVQQGVAERVKTGMYVAMQYAADARLSIDVTATSAVAASRDPLPPGLIQPEPAVVPRLTEVPEAQPAPLPADDEPSVSGLDPADVEDLMEIVLDLLFPTGMHVRAADLKVIADWVESTKRLMYRVRAVEA